MLRDVTVIINPASAGGKTGRSLNPITKLIKTKICNTLNIHVTKRPGDAVVLSERAIKQGTSLIIAVGGDGTLQEVVNGYFDNNRLIGSQCHLGIINCGTGGGLAQSLDIPKSLKGQLDIICKNKVKKIDCGRIEYFDHLSRPLQRYFVNELQFGIGGTVVSQTGKMKKRLGGKLSFGITTVKSVFTHPNQTLLIRADDKKTIDRRFTGIVIANGAFTGGGMNICPGAKTDDGYFNILLINDLSVKERLIAFSKIYSGNHIKNGKFSYFPAKNLRISSAEKVLFEADGELLGNLPCKVELIHKAIPVLVAN